MTVKDVLKTVALLVNRKDILNYLQEGVAENTTDVISEIETLLTCYNVVSDEIASEFYRFTCVEEIITDNGVFKLSNLKRNPLTIISVNNKRGQKVNAKILPNEILCSEREIVVNYSYVPEQKSLTDLCDYDGTPIKNRVLAYGIATEYLLIKGAYEEASLWHEKYISSLKGALSKTKLNKIKARLFL